MSQFSNVNRTNDAHAHKDTAGINKMATTPKMTKDKEVSKAYSVGSNVSCVTCNDEVCRGNVLAFDINFKAIVVGK